MPELPEVETVKEGLKKVLLGRKIKKCVINYNIIEGTNKNKFIDSVINQSFIDIKRRGKWLLFELDNYYLLSHLRMEGKYFIKKIGDEFSKHEHVIFTLDNDLELRYHDTRKFGRMYLINKDELDTCKPLKDLGLEPWDKNLDISYLASKYKNKILPIKTVLLDQSIIAGIGNIYADEILFLSKINPLVKCSTLNDEDLKNIINNTRYILKEAIKLGGTTVKSFESLGTHGAFQNKLFVHSKKNCSKCKGEVIKITVGGRGTYYCPNCQKENN